MRLLTLVIAFFIINSSSAQKPKSFIVKAGEVPADVIPAEALYAFPQFVQGTVYMRDESASATKLNYNLMLDEMQFIGNNGDTLAIAYPETVKKVVVNGFEYYYDKTYLHVISVIDSFKLASKEFFVQSPYRTRGGYDAPTAASSITTYATINSSRSSANLQVKKDVSFDKHVSYFISDKFNHFFKADKKSFLNIYPNKKTLVQDFITKNNIDFSNAEDLEKLLKFTVTAN